MSNESKKVDQDAVEASSDQAEEAKLTDEVNEEPKATTEEQVKEEPKVEEVTEEPQAAAKVSEAPVEEQATEEPKAEEVVEEPNRGEAELGEAEGQANAAPHSLQLSIYPRAPSLDAAHQFTLSISNTRLAGIV